MGEAVKKRPRKPRTTRRVEDTEPKGSINKKIEHRGNPVVVPLGEDMWEITCQASELVPVAQYASVTIGPVAVKRVVHLDSIEDLRGAINEVQQVIYEVIAEDRETVEEEVRKINSEAAEKSK